MGTEYRYYFRIVFHQLLLWSGDGGSQPGRQTNLILTSSLLSLRILFFFVFQRSIISHHICCQDEQDDSSPHPHYTSHLTLIQLITHNSSGLHPEYGYSSPKCPNPSTPYLNFHQKYPSPSLIPERPPSRRSKGLDPGDFSRQDVASPVPRLGTSPPPFFVVPISSWRLSTRRLQGSVPPDRGPVPVSTNF